MEGRRLKILRVSSDLLVNLLSMDGSKRIRIEGMPADARIVDISRDLYFDRDELAFKIESAEFPPCEGRIEEMTLRVLAILDG